MTATTLSTYAASGYTLSPSYDELDITATGGVGGSGVYSNHFATLSNAGTIHNSAAYGRGVVLTVGGVVINRAGGYIDGHYGIITDGSVAVTNYGTIRAVFASVFAASGGSVVNGGYASEGATITGGAIDIRGAPGAVTNFGTIAATVSLGAGGRVTNGAAGDATALISGVSGISIAGGAGAVSNFGTIQSLGFGMSGVYLRSGGDVTNGAATDHTALIQGYVGVRIAGAAGTVTNFGTIRGLSASNFGRGLDLRGGGVVVNGSLNNGGALIEGYTGLSLAGKAAAATNFGTILGVGDLGGSGVYLGGGAALTNGAAGHAKATIEGFTGVETNGKANTVTNFGTIIGAGGTAVRLGSSTDLLVVEAGSTFVGAVIGGGGTLKLDGGIGRLSGLFGAEGDVTVSGSMAATTFVDFAALRIGQAATFTASGNVRLTAGEAILNSGSLTLGGKASVTSAGLIEADRGALTIAGALKNTGTLAAAGGTLAVAGDVTGSGSATIAGGVLDFEAAFTEDVAFTAKTGVLELGRSRGYTGTITGFSTTAKTSLDLDDIAFGKATKTTYAGSKSSGVLTVTDGNHTARINLEGDYRGSTFIATSDGHGGTLVRDLAAPTSISTSAGLFAAAMAGFGAGASALSSPALEPWQAARAEISAPRTHLA
ncbi:MAG: hypothetical protein H0X27_12665 [Caulobacteraceae bacterium]|nr:hypothetical protein [Caulobacteraceae bacterium]